LPKLSIDTVVTTAIGAFLVLIGTFPPADAWVVRSIILVVMIGVLFLNAEIRQAVWQRFRGPKFDIAYGSLPIILTIALVGSVTVNIIGQLIIRQHAERLGSDLATWVRQFKDAEARVDRPTYQVIAPLAHKAQEEFANKYAGQVLQLHDQFESLGIRDRRFDNLTELLRFAGSDVLPQEISPLTATLPAMAKQLPNLKNLSANWFISLIGTAIMVCLLLFLVRRKITLTLGDRISRDRDLPLI
jgi:hypothetical protein